MGTWRNYVTKQLSFTRYATPMEVELDPGQSRPISIHRRGTWRSFPNEGTWEWRDGAGLLFKDGGLYLLGGWNSDRGPMNEVWFTRDFEHWQLLMANASWQGRHGAGWVVHQNRLFVAGGDLIDDVWSSAGGVDWREIAPAPFGKRYTPMAVSDGNRLLFHGGLYWEPYDWCVFEPECSVVGLDDVRTSRTRLAQQAPWSGRGLIHGGAFFRGHIYVIGGGLKLDLPGATLTETVAEYSDVWSSADGIDWRLESEQVAVEPRTHYALTATPHGCYAANGSVGLQISTSSKVFFAPDCVHFWPCWIPAWAPAREFAGLFQRVDRDRRRASQYGRYGDLAILSRGGRVNRMPLHYAPFVFARASCTANGSPEDVKIDE